MKLIALIMATVCGYIAFCTGCGGGGARTIDTSGPLSAATNNTLSGSRSITLTIKWPVASRRSQTAPRVSPQSDSKRAVTRDIPADTAYISVDVTAATGGAEIASATIPQGKSTTELNYLPAGKLILTATAYDSSKNALGNGSTEFTTMVGVDTPITLVLITDSLVIGDGDSITLSRAGVIGTLLGQPVTNTRNSFTSVQVDAGGKFILQGGGSIIGDGTDYGALYNNGGSVTIAGGTIYGGTQTGTATRQAGIYSSGKVTMTAGVITGAPAIQPVSGTFAVSGGTVTGVGFLLNGIESNDVGILAEGTAKGTVSGGTITSSIGGGIDTEDSASITVSGGRVTGIFAGSPGTLISINGGVIAGGAFAGGGTISLLGSITTKNSQGKVLNSPLNDSGGNYYGIISGILVDGGSIDVQFSIGIGGTIQWN